MGTARDWSGLPEDLLLNAMAAMEVPDVVRSGYVCSAWRSAYATFRRLRLSTPNQPPCLLYPCVDAGGTDAALLYSPSTNATFRLPPLHSVVGSANGWLFTTDEAANPYLLNPVTGARVALPPVTGLQRVKSSFLDGEGNAVYDVDFAWNGGPDMQHVTARKARGWMYRRAAISGAGTAACVVLLVHMPHGELSFARPGDERWTPVPEPIKWISLGFVGVAHDDERSGLFYVLRTTGRVRALDLSGPSPVMRTVWITMRTHGLEHSHYLLPTPCGRSVLLLTRQLRRSVEFPEDDDDDDDDDEDNSEGCGTDRRSSNSATTHIYIEEILLEGGIDMPKGVGDNALFLGRNSAVCFPVAGNPVLKPNCAYLVDDCEKLTLPVIRRDFGIWDFDSGSLHELGDAWPPLRPCSDTSIPIWITPSLY